MLRPERMARALIVGPRDRLSPTIDALHRMRLLHVVDHRGEDDTFRIGTPLPPAAVHSESLVKLRSISSILQVPSAATPSGGVELATIRGRIATLELNITEEAGAKKETEALLSDLSRRIEELRPFATLGFDLGLYRGYESLGVLVGRIPRGVPQFDAKFPTSELFAADGVLAVFVRKEDFEPALSFLTGFGFARLDIPTGDGDPRALLAAAEKDREKWETRRAEAEARLEKLRERYAGFVVAAQEALEVEVEKAEAPLRFAVSEHSFVADGWVPASRIPELSDLERLGIYVETAGPRHGDSEMEPPVLLRNPKPAKPFEFLIHLYSTPSYHELDPTAFLLIAFPFFFGFMIGDVGYGAFFLGIGLVAIAKLPKGSDFRNLLAVIAVGGFWSLLFGAFVFGEMFGMPFHPPHAAPEELAWDQFGLNYPLEALIHKSFGIGEMVYLSILFAAVHLGASFVMGFVNEVSHNKRHAIAKVGWILCLFGVFTVLTMHLAWTRPGAWVWNVALGWFPRDIQPAISSLLGRGVPTASVVLILGALLAMLESPVAPIEIPGLVGNMFSYTRLAAIGVGKASIAAAFNTQILENLILHQGIGLVIFGFVLFILAQMVVFLLGGISAGIQGIRLNYVESFIKFYKGNGTRFVPFGARKPQEA